MLLALLLLVCSEQLCQASCESRFQNVQNGSLEVCGRNDKDDIVYLPLCAEPTAVKTASVFCRTSSCDRTCNQYNYTIAYKPGNVTGFIYQCEPNDNRPVQCDVTIGLCDSVMETLNCECNNNSCSGVYVSPGFCENNTCSCLPGYGGDDCLDSVCEIGLLRTDTPVEICDNPFASGEPDWFPICTSSSDFLSIVRPICGRTNPCRRDDCVRANLTFTPSTNTTIGYSVACEDPLDTLSMCNLTYGRCSHYILATLECSDTCSRECKNGGFCLINHTCACPPAYTGDTCELLANSTKRFLIIVYALSPLVIICTILSICVILLIVYIKRKPSKLKSLEKVIIFAQRPKTQSMCMEDHAVDTEHMYASVKFENMLENTDRTTSARYTTSSKLSASAKKRDRNSTNLNSVENQLYFALLPNARPIEHQYSCSTASIRNKPLHFSSSIALSHRQRVDSTQSDYLMAGESYFTNNGVFVEPPNDVEGIYNTLADLKFREISRTSISLQKQLGSGYFGDVLRAEWKMEQDTEPIPVAAKCLRDNADSKLKLSFLTEAAIMGQFDHPNVLRLLGIISLSTPYMLIIELMAGDLKAALESISAANFGNEQLLSCLLKSTREIVSGMEYLSSKHFVHRDLAVRNVLVGQDMVCRIGDFGMSKRIHEDKDYYRVESGGVVPVRWTAPEALFFRRYSEKSDVWSLGMTLFEVWSVGQKPWGSCTNEQVVGMVSIDEMQGPPTGCPREIYAIMVQTWNANAAARPTFQEIAQFLRKDDEQLLSIPEEVKSDQLGQLGHDPALSADLYSDLRN